MLHGMVHGMVHGILTTDSGFSRTRHRGSGCRHIIHHNVRMAAIASNMDGEAPPALDVPELVIGDLDVDLHVLLASLEGDTPFFRGRW